MDETAEQTNGITGAALRLFAAATMLIDHFAGSILDFAAFNSSAGWDIALLRRVSLGLHLVGRLAFPIFVFLLVEGFFHTRSRARYLKRLAVLALVSEFPFDLALMLWRSDMQAGIWLRFEHQNVGFTLAIGLLVMWACEKLLERGRAIGVLGGIAAVVCGCLVAELLQTDYSWGGVLAIAGAYAVRRVGMKDLAIPLIVLPLSIMYPVELVALLDWIFIHFYNGERGRTHGRLFYAFYPAHLLVLGILKVLLVFPMA